MPDVQPALNIINLRRCLAGYNIYLQAFGCQSFIPVKNIQEQLYIAIKIYIFLLNVWYCHLHRSVLVAVSRDSNVSLWSRVRSAILKPTLHFFYISFVFFLVSKNMPVTPI